MKLSREERLGQMESKSFRHVRRAVDGTEKQSTAQKKVARQVTRPKMKEKKEERDDFF